MMFVTSLVGRRVKMSFHEDDSQEIVYAFLDRGMVTLGILNPDGHIYETPATSVVIKNEK